MGERLVMKICLTGYKGFIGSHLLESLVNYCDDEIVCIDALTYASDKNNIPSKVLLYPYDISNKDEVSEVFAAYKPNYVFHLAA